MIEATFETSRQPLGGNNRLAPAVDEQPQIAVVDRSSKTSEKTPRKRRHDGSPKKRARLPRAFQPDTLPRHSIDRGIVKAKKAWQDREKRGVFNVRFEAHFEN